MDAVVWSPRYIPVRPGCDGPAVSWKNGCGCCGGRAEHICLRANCTLIPGRRWGDAARFLPRIVRGAASTAESRAPPCVSPSESPSGPGAPTGPAFAPARYQPVSVGSDRIIGSMPHPRERTFGQSHKDVLRLDHIPSPGTSHFPSGPTPDPHPPREFPLKTPP